MEAFFLQRYRSYVRYHDLPGETTCCVYLHGLGSASSSVFPRIVRHPLLVCYRCLLIDFLGFGFSDRPEDFSYTLEEHASTAAELLDHLNVKESAVIGHSMGGSIAIVLTAKRPDLVSSLIVAEGNLDPGPGMVSGPIAAQSEAEFLENGYEVFLRAVTSEGWADYAGTVQASDPRALYRSAVSLIKERKPTLRERFVSLSIPRTFIFGERNLPDPDVERLSGQGIRVSIVENAGHDMMGDNPDGFAQVLSEALA